MLVVLHFRTKVTFPFPSAEHRNLSFISRGVGRSAKQNTEIHCDFMGKRVVNQVSKLVYLSLLRNSNKDVTRIDDIITG